MLFFRLLRLLLWPIWAPLRLLLRSLRRLFRFGVQAGGEAEMAARKGAAISTVGAITKMQHDGPEPLDVSKFVFFQTFEFRENDEPMMTADNLALAQKMADRCRTYFDIKPNLFPPD